MRFLIGFGFLKGGDLGFGQHDAVLCDLGFQRLEAPDRRFGISGSRGPRPPARLTDPVALARSIRCARRVGQASRGPEQSLLTEDQAIRRPVCSKIFDASIAIGLVVIDPSLNTDGS
jgi:hypothetical protein